MPAPRGRLRITASVDFSTRFLGDIVADFLARGSVQGLTPTCGTDPALVRPPFFTSFAGPTP